ncbi:MAG: DoxX family protein [Bacteroidetes bacterium]|nr:MAG: DoxX family protein [Bacteroidota bacterium]TAG93812.1 MAG: DoxX family protein [Bacteroidota bacterium]
MQYLRLFSIIFVGGLFIFSGLIKLNDPVGTQIKLEEYFEVFATDKTELGLSSLASFWHFLLPFSLSLSIILSSLEVVLGASLLLRYKVKSTLWWLLGTIIFFTFLTFYSAYFNKVTDCGCFGDFIKLTPWTSFTKDIVLLFFIGFLFIQRRKIVPNETKLVSWSVFGVSLFSFFIGMWATWYLPWFDFLPYKIGDNIPANMRPKEPLRYGEQEYWYKDLKENKNIKLSKKEFETQWEKYSDSLKYKYLEMKNPLLNPEAQPKINSFADSLVMKQIFSGNKFLIIIAEARRTSVKYIKELNLLVKELEKKKIQSLVLSGDEEKVFEAFRHQYQLAVPYFLLDKTILKTMIRTNPGYMFLNNGTVVNKWAEARLPNINQFN